jgi:hypothetical protein
MQAITAAATTTTKHQQQHHDENSLWFSAKMFFLAENGLQPMKIAPKVCPF